MPAPSLTTDNKQPTTILRRLARNEWLKAFVFALLILLVLHLFVVRFVSVQSTSMFSTLLPGDLLLVERWPKWTGLDRDDIVVFRDPLRDKESKSARTLMVKRVAAVAGDVLEIRRGNVLINGKPVAPAEGVTISFLVRLKEDASVKDFLARQHMPEELAHGGRNNLELPLNAAMAKRVEQDEAVVSVTRMRLANGPQLHLFPFSPRYGWNGDNYGPITVPGKGDTLHITVDNLPLYDRLMCVYEGHTITAAKNELLLDGAPLKNYIVEQDYYFVLGDSRHYSADSRYWGFFPADHVVGRGGGVVWGGSSN